MGNNATVIVLTDALGDIKKDPDFGKNLVDAVLARGFGVNTRGVDVSARGYVNAACVLEIHHADYFTLVAVGGNHGVVLGHSSVDYPDTNEKKVKMLREIADKLGYRLCLKPSRRTK